VVEVAEVAVRRRSIPSLCSGAEEAGVEVEHRPYPSPGQEVEEVEEGVEVRRM